MLNLQNVLRSYDAKSFKDSPEDNVLVALKDLKKGEVIEFDGRQYTLADTIAAKHKFFMRDMKEGDEVKMYGVLVGKIQEPVVKGGLMTTSNIKHASEPFTYRPYSYSWQPPDVAKFRNKTFKGYPQSDGRVGTANYWLFIQQSFAKTVTWM
jgi:altronate hydrolase